MKHNPRLKLVSSHELGGYTPPMKLPLRRTHKANGDHVVINPALKAWMEGRR